MNDKKTVMTLIICILSISTLVCAGMLIYLVNKPEPVIVETPTPQIEEPGPIAEETCESVNFKIEKDDLSFENEERGLYLSQFFEKVVITDEGENFEKINLHIDEISNRFINDSKENEAFVRDEQYLNNMHYKNETTAKVTKNEDGVLSVKMTNVWFMGGVVNANTYGMNFDLNTGEELNLPEYLGLTKSETERLFKEESKNNIKEGYFENAAETIDGYSLEDFNYYLEGKNILLCYSTYELAPGAAGPIIMTIPVPEKE